MGTHYTEDQNGQWLVDYAILRAAKIEEVFAGNKHVGLIYSGMSGVSRATALAMYCKVLHGRDLGMVYVRKENEKTYSCRDLEVANMYKEDRDDKSVWSLIFVDDLISSGGTKTRCIDAVENHWPAAPYNKIVEKPSVKYRLLDYDAEPVALNSRRTFRMPD